MDARVRTPIVAGAFYPGQSAPLRDQIERLIPDGHANAQVPLRSMQGLIVPHAGYIYSGSVASAGFCEVARQGAPDAIVILGASHTGFEPWFALPPHESWETPLGRSPVDQEIVARLEEDGFRVAEPPFVREHSMEVQLPLIQYLWGQSIPILPICVVPAPMSRIQAAADALFHALEGRSALLVASSDFTHYQPDAIARALDRRALDRILALDVAGFRSLCLEEKLSICGTGAIEILMTIAQENGLTRTKLVSYATSGDASGDVRSVVGYASVHFSKEIHG